MYRYIIKFNEIRKIINVDTCTNDKEECTQLDWKHIDEDDSPYHIFSVFNSFCIV